MKSLCAGACAPYIIIAQNTTIIPSSVMQITMKNSSASFYQSNCYANVLKSEVLDSYKHFPKVCFDIYWHQK